MTLDSFGKNETTGFLISLVSHFRSRRNGAPNIFLVLDNAPKNKSNRINEIVNLGLFHMVFTTPITPQHNFIESIFFFVKQRLNKKYFDEERDSSFMGMIGMAARVVEVLKTINQETFAVARRMWLHDLSLT